MTPPDTAGEHRAAPSPAPLPLDWGRGAWERVAPVLLPAAESLLRAASPREGEQVLDIGCGSGTVARLAARRGAEVTAVDPAPRLLTIGEQTARQEGLRIRFLHGEAAALPIPDHGFDLVLSNFGVVFAAEPAAAVAEMVRAVRSEGRIVFTAWIPGGLMGRLAETAQDLVRDAVGAPEPPPPFPWHDPAALSPLFAPCGLTLTSDEHRLAFTAASPQEYLERDLTSHPLAVAGFDLLARAGLAQSARSRLVTLLEDGNEDPTAFRATSRYAVLTATRAPA